MSASLHSPYTLFHVSQTVIAVRKNQLDAKTLMSYVVGKVYGYVTSHNAFLSPLFVTILANFRCFSFRLHFRGDVIEIIAYST